jgi:uncharacterized protein (TIGR02757 family)
MKKLDKKFLDGLYKEYNKPQYIHPDPLEFLSNYKNLRDREIVALIASALAYGRVGQIIKSVGIVLDKMGESPYEFVINGNDATFKKTFCKFKHRFTAGCDISQLMINMQNALKKYKSLNKCFIAGLKKNDGTIIPAISFFADMVGKNIPFLIPHPSRGSACKRLNLFLRWMVRRDEVDPGGWKGVPSSKLIIPLDTHMHKISRMFGLTKRKQANMKTAIEITRGFAAVEPKDPTKYDFSLTRFGIRSELKYRDIMIKRN